MLRRPTRNALAYGLKERVNVAPSLRTGFLFFRRPRRLRSDVGHGASYPVERRRNAELFEGYRYRCAGLPFLAGGAPDRR